MTDTAIKVEQLSKVYKLYNKPIDRLKESLHPFRKKYHRNFHALNDLSFEIKKGETVGIIGANGSGKSTLLKILTGVLTPTGGNVITSGKISALLELGTGFNPEFTGLENIYFSGTIMGYTKEEMDAKLQGIIDFAEIGDFIYQPVKCYSSGMYVRLAFAVAINVDPQILVIDEALSVGDELFQRKCFSRIQAIRNNGATVLFVSHSGVSIIELCDQAILLDSGKKLAMGVPKMIVGEYQKLLYAPADKRETIRQAIITSFSRADLEPQEDGDCSSSVKHKADDELKELFDPNLQPQATLKYESHGAYIDSPKILTLKGKRVNCLISGKTYRYTFNVRFELESYDIRFGMMIKAMNGTELGGIGSAPVGFGIKSIKAGEFLTVCFNFKCTLLPGFYFLNSGCSGNITGEDVFLDRIVDAVAFRVLPTNYAEARAGYIDFADKESVFSIEHNLKDCDKGIRCEEY